jgi:hypothetical protein
MKHLRTLKLQLRLGLNRERGRGLDLSPNQRATKTGARAGLINRLLGLVSAGLIAALAGCADKPPEIKAALGTVVKVQFEFAGWNDQSQIEAAGRSISVQGIAPIPLNAAVELRGNRQNAELLCVAGTQRCWPIHQPEQHDWTLLNLKP